MECFIEEVFYKNSEKEKNMEYNITNSIYMKYKKFTVKNARTKNAFSKDYLINNIAKLLSKRFDLINKIPYLNYFMLNYYMSLFQNT
jgi:hypothetical protein